MSILNNSLLLGADAGGYQISRSLRFNSSDSAYLSRTPASAGNRKTWTFSFWTKRSNIVTRQLLLEVKAGSNDTDYFAIEFTIDTTAPRLAYGGWNTTWGLTRQVFRDVSAWYHIVLAVDTTQSTANNRIKLYVNGAQVTNFDIEAYPAQNADTGINATSLTTIGSGTTGSNSYSGYLADIHFIDGQALTPSSFAETNATTGQWVPKAYTGSYGTNGFRLDFSDNSAATATTLGKDRAGSNNWTPNNLSVTAGAGNDSLVDTPTSYGTDTGAGGEVRGNYCTWNPLSAGNTTLSNGNLSSVTSNQAGACGTIQFPPSNKWFFDLTFSIAGTSNNHIGIIKSNPTVAMLATTANTDAVLYRGDGNIFRNTGGGYSVVQTVSSYTSGDVIGVAVNNDASTIQFYKNGSTVGTAINLTAATEYTPFIHHGGGQSGGDANFGQRPFAYTAPSGFKALCDTNLPAPVVAKPSESFQTVLWTGDNTSNRTITTGLRSGFVWIKNRSASGPTHILHDVVRGAGQTLYTSSTSAEVNNGTAYVQQFNATNFLLGAPDSASNASGNSYVGWVWDPGASTVTNTSGSISSQVRANASAGFSIVTYTGNGTVGATVGHGLGVAPAMLIVKRRDAASAARWAVQHTSLTAAQLLALNTTAAVHTEGAGAGSTFNVTKAGSSVFTLGDYGDSNANTGTYVAYCFAPVAGYSSFGSYTGNGSTDGPFVFTGFRPRWVMIKNSSANSLSAYGSWKIIDASRDSYNGGNPAALYANASYAEGKRGNGDNDTYTERLDLLSNGFKLGAASTYDIETNESGVTYIYAAFAESPFAYARAR